MKVEAESQPFASTTPPGPWSGNTSCTSCRCHTDRDRCVGLSWITLGLSYHPILSILDKHRIADAALTQASLRMPESRVGSCACPEPCPAGDVRFRHATRFPGSPRPQPVDSRT